MNYLAYLRGRDLFILDEAGRQAFSDFLYYKNDMVTADRVLGMYGWARSGHWREHSSIPGIRVCEVKGEEEKVQ